MMNNIILALILLLTPFFLPFNALSTQYPPDIKDGWSGICSIGDYQGAISGEGQYTPSTALTQCRDNFVEPTYDDSTCGTSYYVSQELIVASFKSFRVQVECTGTNRSFSFSASITDLEEKTVTSCPPEDFPDYGVGVDTTGDGEIDSCQKSSLEECPVGNYAFKVGGECIPVQCEAQGSGGNIWAKGDVYSNNSGTYCDGSCAHSVSGGQNPTGSSGNVSIYAVSTGQSCGQGTDFAMHDGDGSDCESQDVGTGTNYLSCSNSAESPDLEPPLDLEQQEYVLEEMQELIPIEETCTIGDVSCEIRNLKETTKTENSEQKQLDIEMHNLAIQSEQKSTQSVLDTLNDNSNQQTQGLEMINSTLNDIKNNGLGSSGGVGGGSSDGFCDQEGNCSTGVETKTEPSEGLKGFWVSEYEDGLEGIFNDKLAELQSSDFYVFLESFSPTISGGSAPDMNMCFDLGFISFGCQSFSIDPRVYPAIGVFILISAAFLCRFILFGG